jgi:hypothetical protein
MRENLHFVTGETIWTWEGGGCNKDQIKLHHEELHNSHSSPYIVRVTKSRMIRWTRHVARMGNEPGGSSEYFLRSSPSEDGTRTHFRNVVILYKKPRTMGKYIWLALNVKGIAYIHELKRYNKQTFVWRRRCSTAVPNYSWLLIMV